MNNYASNEISLRVNSVPKNKDDKMFNLMHHKIKTSLKVQNKLGNLILKILP